MRSATGDLLLTVPRYRLETVMSDRLSATTLNVIITLLVAGGLISFMMGVGPGILLVGVAVVLAVAQRTTLARAAALRVVLTKLDAVTARSLTSVRRARASA